MLALACFAACLSFAGPDDVVAMKPFASGAMQRFGYYRPVRAELSPERPATLTKLPDGVTPAVYGVLPIQGSGTYHVAMTVSEERVESLFVDANGNGDLSDDPLIDWKGVVVGKTPDGTDLRQHSGTIRLNLGTPDKPREVTLGGYRFDPRAPGREALASTLLYYRDYGVEGRATIGGKEYAVYLSDENATGNFQPREIDGDSTAIAFFLDRNADGKFAAQGESFAALLPFNIDGESYRLADVAPDGSSLRIVVSDQKVDEIPLPPDHSVGKAITPFTATLMSGQEVKFPADYKGKVVLLDFWATWCGPCIREVPHLVEAYKAYHDQGFEILGISLDQKDQTQKINEVMKEHSMTWPQVYDGGFWKARIAQQYVIHSIPAVFLVDGDTGEILGLRQDLGGDKLKQAIEKALAKKKSAK